MFEILKEVDEETVNKEKIILLTIETTAPFIFDDVEDLYEITTLLMLEADVKKKRKLKDDFVFILNDV